MTIDRFLPIEITIIRRVETGRDPVGAPLFGESTETVRAALHRVVGSQSVPGERVDEGRWRLLTAPGVALIGPYDTVEVGGEVFVREGMPLRSTNQRTGQVRHIETILVSHAPSGVAL